MWKDGVLTGVSTCMPDKKRTDTTQLLHEDNVVLFRHLSYFECELTLTLLQGLSISWSRSETVGFQLRYLRVFSYRALNSQSGLPHHGSVV